MYYTYAFYKCGNLKSISFSDSVSSIGSNAFDGTPWWEEQVANNNSVTVNNILCYVSDDVEGEFVIPNSVTSIGHYAFYLCSDLNTITIPNSVMSIADGAFCYCGSLSSIIIPNSVKSIGNSAFVGCYSLNSITIPNSVTSIGDSAFRDCGNLSSITIPKSVTSIGERVFEYCGSLESITVTKGSYAEQWAKDNGFADKLVIK